MKYLLRIMYFSLSIFLMSCNFVPCEKVTDKDIVGYYVSGNSINKNKQYIKILDNHTFTMAYCNGDTIVTEQGTWNRYNGCSVSLDGIRWLGFSYVDASRRTVFFSWVRGKLTLGEYATSFQKVWNKPKLNCEK